MLLLKGGTVYGKNTGPADVLIDGGKIIDVAHAISETEEMTVLDVSGLAVAPGLVDLHVHFREPGFEYKEDIMTGAAAAAAGGVTTCLCMPNTSPVIDSAETVNLVTGKALNAPIRVLTAGAVTVGQKGAELTDFNALKSAGAVALSDDGLPVQSAALMRKAMQHAKASGLTIISHCEDEEMVKNYGVNEGAVSEKLALQGRPAIAEEIMVARDVMLANETGAHVHIAHVSTAGAVDIIRKARQAGANVTAETCPQYFSLTEDEVLRQGALARVNPPLRTGNDVEAIIAGLQDGTLDAIATDHAPHSMEEKTKPLPDAMSGLVGLETSLALALTHLYHTGKFSLEKIIALMSANPAKIIGIDAGVLDTGACADIVIFDHNEEWTVDPEKFKSKGRNTPFGGQKLCGRIRYTISRGEIVYKQDK
ncbi:MAG: dihydroorotase [Oscillospiraceae bacterium]|nr:dihydroorotase [Oscillospiraceae bacterium]